MSIDETVRGAQGGPGPQRAPSEPRSGPDGQGPGAPPPDATAPDVGEAAVGSDEWGAGPDDLVTRYLCAAAYLRGTFADQVARDLIWPVLGAMAPLWQVDALRLVQHARRARTARRMRDRWLAAVVGCLLVTVAVLVGLRLGHRLSVADTLALTVLMLVWAYGCAVALVHRQYLAARRNAVAAAYGPDDTEPTMEPASLEQALIDLNHANVVFFEGDSSPFLGSGELVDRWSMTIDVSKGLIGPGQHHPGNGHQREHRQPAEFTGAQLQEFLLAAIPQVVHPRPAAGHRLYVRGGSNAPVADLFRSGPVVENLAEAVRFRRPVNRVPAEVVQRHLTDPDEAARVYTFFQHSAWGGQIVVTLFVRAYVSNRTLFVEGLVYSLRPLSPGFYQIRALAQRPWVELSSVFADARADAWSLLVGSPLRVFRAGQNPLPPRVFRRMEREVNSRRDLDFGAHQSLRERSAADQEGMDHFPAVDERMYHQIFNRRVLECIGEFLASKNVDTVEFSRQQSSIVNRMVADVHGAMVDFGSVGARPSS